jgi:DNA polymerase
MLVGEQPGDKEDLEGAPFIGPAGAVLRKAMEELGLDGKHVFMTNAVKHFKFTQRGKLRLHQSPRMTEINACRPWLVAEIDAVRPKVILCLGATAAKSLLGGTFALMRDRGKLHKSVYGKQVAATVHPSAVLRARDEAGRAQLLHYLKDDLAMAYATALGKHL